MTNPINMHCCIGFLKTQSQAQGCAELDNKDSLRKAVESLFNKLYGKYVCVNYSVYIHDHCTEHSHVSLCLIH